MHVHLWEKKPMFDLYLANGVIGVRDMGSDLARTRGWRADIEAGRVKGPHIYTSGSPIDGPSRDSPKLPVIHVRNAEEGRRAVDAIDTQRADFIKVLSTPSADAYFALAQRARVIRAVFAGHVPESVTVAQAVDARQKSMEHLFGMNFACSGEEPQLREQRAEAIANKDYATLANLRQRAIESFDETRCTELLRKMARFDVWQTPTLSMLQRLALIGLDELATDKHLAQVSADVQSTWEDPRDDLRKANADQLARFKRNYEFQEKLVGLMQRSRVGILAGTDTGDPYVLPGYSLHDELALLTHAGLTPAQAIRTATLNPAKYFNIERVAGTIAPGKRADLVLLNENPIEDIRNTRKIAAVYKGGRLVWSAPVVTKRKHPRRR